MGKNRKQHAKDYLHEFKKKVQEDWFISLIDEVVEYGVDIQKDFKHNVFRSLLELNGLKTKNQRTKQKTTKRKKAEINYITATGSKKLQIKKLRHIEGVNALTKNQEIDVAKDCTLIYGLNGSGKSGYFRVINEISGGEHKKNILTDATKNIEEQRVDIEYSDDDSDLKIFSWDHSTPRRIAPFDQINVFDGNYLPLYLDERSNKLDVAPYGIDLISSLHTHICEFEDRVKLLIKKQTEKLHDLSPLVDQLNDREMKTTLVSKVKKSQFYDNHKNHFNFRDSDLKKLDELGSKLKILQKLDYDAKEDALQREVEDIDEARDDLTDSIQHIFDFVQEYSKALANYNKKKATRNKIQKEIQILKKIPLAESEQWQEFIDSAFLYQQELIDQEVDFDPEQQCIYCHQSLGEDAKRLINAYALYLEDNSQEEFREAQAELDEIQDQVKLFNPNLALSQRQKKILFGEIFKVSKYSDTAVYKLIQEIKNCKKNLLSAYKKKQPCANFDIRYKLIINKLSKYTAEKEKLVTKLQKQKRSHQNQIDKVIASISRLQDKKTLNKWKERIQNNEKIENNLNLLRYIDLSNRKRDLTNLAKKVQSDLVTNELISSFKSELKHLKCNLDITFTSRGQDVNILHSKKIHQHNLKEILSEGEQKAVALSLFLAEIDNQNFNSPCVFDDPVNSLDFQISNQLADRLATLSKNQQVIIFTHSLIFASQFVKACNKYDLELSTHMIVKQANACGKVESNTAPKMNDLGLLKKKAETCISNYNSASSEKRELLLGNACDYLRSAVECLIEEVAFAKTITRFQDHVRVSNLEEVVFDEGLFERIVSLHGEISRVGLMHNRSDFQMQEGTQFSDYQKCKDEFDDLIVEFKKLRKERIKQRDAKRKHKKNDPVENWN